MKKKLSLGIISFLLCLFLTVPVFAQNECAHQWEILYRTEPDCTFSGTERRYCTLCYKSETIVLPPTGHIWSDWEMIVESDCTHPGVMSRSCTICHFAEHKDAPTNDAHSWSSWISSTGLCTEVKQRYRYCYYCGKKEYNNIPATDHVWGRWYTDKKATIFQSGSKIQYCSNCSAKNKVTIPKLKMTSSQKQVKKSVDAFFKYAKQYNTGKLKKCFSKPSTVQLFVDNNYMAKYFQKYNKRISYTLKSIKVKGKKATVSLTYKYPNRYNTFSVVFENAFYYKLENPYISDSQLYKYMYDKACQNSKAGTDYSYGKLTLELRKYGSAWKITSFSSKINNLIHSNYPKAYNDYFNSRL